MGDLRRWLANEPIHARPPTRLDRAIKWSMRNPAKSAVAAVVTSALIVISALLAENVRARGVAEERRVAAELAAEREKLRADEVLRLSALQELEDLVVEADGLWPAQPENIPRFEDWLARARGRLAELPQHRSTLEKLRASALPRTEEERRADRESHPEYPALASTRDESAQRRAANAASRAA